MSGGKVGAGVELQGLKGFGGDGRDDNRFVAAFEDGGGGGGLGVSGEARILGGGLAGEERLGVVCGDPAALLGDADGDDVVLLLVDGLEDGGSREE